MHTEYEAMLKDFLPALRASSAKILAGRYETGQGRTAELLGITQAAVSKYVNGKYSARVKELERGLPQGDVERFIEMLIKGDEYEAQRVVCRMCSRNLSFKCGLMIK